MTPIDPHGVRRSPTHVRARGRRPNTARVRSVKSRNNLMTITRQLGARHELRAISSAAELHRRNGAGREQRIRVNACATHWVMQCTRGARTRRRLKM